MLEQPVRRQVEPSSGECDGVGGVSTRGQRNSEAKGPFERVGVERSAGEGRGVGEADS